MEISYCIKYERSFKPLHVNNFFVPEGSEMTVKCFVTHACSALSVADTQRTARIPASRACRKRTNLQKTTNQSVCLMTTRTLRAENYTQVCVYDDYTYAVYRKLHTSLCV